MVSLPFFCFLRKGAKTIGKHACYVEGGAKSVFKKYKGGAKSFFCKKKEGPRVFFIKKGGANTIFEGETF